MNTFYICILPLVAVAIIRNFRICAIFISSMCHNFIQYLLVFIIFYAFWYYIKLNMSCNFSFFRYCDVFQKCREVDPSGPLATLRRLLLSEESIASFKKWITSNWYTVALVVIAVIVLLVSTTICIATSRVMQTKKNLLILLRAVAIRKLCTVVNRKPCRFFLCIRLNIKNFVHIQLHWMPIRCIQHSTYIQVQYHYCTAVYTIQLHYRYYIYIPKMQHFVTNIVHEYMNV